MFLTNEYDDDDDVPAWWGFAIAADKPSLCDDLAVVG